MTTAEAGQSHAIAPDVGAYDCNRLLASVLVLFSHSYVLSGAAEAEPLSRWTGHAHDFGQVAVYLFFAMSGYLVTQSWQRDPNITRFLQRRALRILPALAAVVVISALVIGPLITQLSLSAYLRTPATWTYLGKITTLPAQQGLPGLFANNPFPLAVNGSLWTLRLEVTCYVGLAVLGITGLLRWKWASVAVIVLMIGGDAVLSRLGLRPAMAEQIGTYLANVVVFFTGVMLAQIGLPQRPWRLAVVSWPALALLLIVDTGLAPIFWLVFAIAAVCAGACLQCRIKQWGDYSYGIYLWAFPIQQTLMDRQPSLTALSLFAEALPLTFLAAILSWHLIERRALSFKPGRVRG